MPRLPAQVLALMGDTSGGAGIKYGNATQRALALARTGERVFPCHQIRHGVCTCKDRELCKAPGKHPRTRRGVLDATSRLDGPNGIVAWAQQFPNANWGLALDDRIVVDIDVADGKDGWATWNAAAAKAGVDLAQLRTWTIRTGRGGTQFVFRLPPGVKSTQVRDKLGVAVDLRRGPGHYIMVPGSVTSAEYTVVAEEPELICPGWVIDTARAYVAAQKAAATRAAKKAGHTGHGLSVELAYPNDAPDKGNDWASRAFGYLAAGLKREGDLFAIARLLVKDQMRDPMTDEDVLKVVRSVLRAEYANHGVRHEDAVSDRQCGYLRLADDGRSVEILTTHGDMEVMHEYLNCGVVAKMIVDDGERRFYLLEIRGAAHNGPKYITVEPSTLVDPRTRARFFADLGYTIDPPRTPAYEMTDSARLVRFVESQKPPTGRAAPCLGWTGDRFLTPDGMFVGDGTDGLVEFDDQIPHPDVVSSATATYGDTVSREELVQVLREVYTFQTPRVASVAMSWLLICLLKGTYHTSIAPILYVDASSGSGKTNGFFAFLVALSGNTSGSGTITVPRIRQQLAANRNGIVWVDDISNIRGLDETLRQAASRGTHTKTDTTDNKGTIIQHMVGNVLLSCEGVGRTMSEKAMRDRVIRLQVPSVRDRKSHKGDYPQWEDIKALLGRYGARSEDYAPFARRMAGTLVRTLARYAPLQLEVAHGGRHGEKHALLRAGARVLADLLGFDEPVAEVEAWIALDQDLGGQNLFIGEIAPRLLREFGYPSGWLGRRFGNDNAIMPLFVEGNRIYVNPGLCADEWSKLRDTDARDRQLGSKEAIQKELADVGVTARGSRVERRNRDTGVRLHYWQLSRELSGRILERSPEARQESL